MFLVFFSHSKGFLQQVFVVFVVALAAVVLADEPAAYPKQQTYSKPQSYDYVRLV